MRTPLLTALLAAITLSGILRAEVVVKTEQPNPAYGTVEEVVIVFKTHFDIGYTAMAREVVQRYRTSMIDQALNVCDASKGLPAAQQFAWTIPGWPMSKILEDGDGMTPEKKARIQQALKDGRFILHGLPFSTHTETLEPEDLVRGMGYSARISRALNLDLPRDAKMTDVPCHSWILPTLLHNAGIDFLHLGCNGGSRSPTLPRLFWWEGPDGSRLLTMYTAEGYGTGLYPPKDWPHPVWLALIHTGDNHGPPTPDEVKKLLDESALKLPGVKVRIGRLSDFADALLKRNPQLPIVRSDMPDTWIHGPMCDPAGAKIARNIRPQIAAADALQTQLRCWGVQVPDATGAVGAAYEKSLLYGEHTWGGALYWVTKYAKGQVKFPYGEAFKTEHATGRFSRLEESWAEHTGYIESARDLVAPLMNTEMESLAKNVNAEGARVVVYNPLPYKRDAWVSVKIPGDCNLFKAIGEGDEAPAAAANGVATFVARGLPPGGYKTYSLQSVKVQARELGSDAQTFIENAAFKATLDPVRCCVKSLVDKQSGRELIDSASPYGFGQYLYERFDAEQVAEYVKAYVKVKADWAITEIGKPTMPSKDQAPYMAASPVGGTLKFEPSLCGITAVMSAPASGNIKHAVTMKLTLYTHLPYADFEITLHDKPADSWPEAGWFCFPFRVDEPQFRLGRLGGIVDPATDCIENSNHELFWLNTGVAVIDSKGNGAGLCPLDHPLISLGQPGCERFSSNFTPRKPVVFVNLFNNQWTTNFRMWNSGTWTSRVRIWSIDKYDAEKSLVTPCMEARNPLLAAYTDAPPGKLPVAQAGLKLSRRGVAVTAFGKNPDGPGTVLRVWEQAGTSGELTTTLPAGATFTTATSVNLRGEKTGEALKLEGGKLLFTLGRYAPASFILQ